MGSLEIIKRVNTLAHEVSDQLLAEFRQVAFLMLSPRIYPDFNTISATALSFLTHTILYKSDYTNSEIEFSKLQQVSFKIFSVNIF